MYQCLIKSSLVILFLLNKVSQLWIFHPCFCSLPLALRHSWTSLLWMHNLHCHIWFLYSAWALCSKSGQKKDKTIWKIIIADNWSIEFLKAKLENINIIFMTFFDIKIVTLLGICHLFLKYFCICRKFLYYNMMLCQVMVEVSPINWG